MLPPIAPSQQTRGGDILRWRRQGAPCEAGGDLIPPAWLLIPPTNERQRSKPFPALTWAGRRVGVSWADADCLLNLLPLTTYIAACLPRLTSADSFHPNSRILCCNLCVCVESTDRTNMASAADDAAAVEDAEEPPKKRIYSVSVSPGGCICWRVSNLGHRHAYTVNHAREDAMAASRRAGSAPGLVYSVSTRNEDAVVQGRSPSPYPA